MTKYRSGVRIEHKAIRFLQDAGYTAIRSAGSKGMFDVVAVNSEVVRLIQCKNASGNASFSGEFNAIKSISVPDFCTRELWIHKKHYGWDKFLVVAQADVEFPDRGEVNYEPTNNI